MKKQKQVERIARSSNSNSMTRRSVLKATAASVIGYQLAGDAATLNASLTDEKTRNRYQQSHIAVIGAGGFGGWTALSLLRKGDRKSVV